MNKLLVAMLLLPLAQGAASAQTAGDPAAGKTYWERDAPRATACRNCHGLQGQGAFGPDLAGRGLNAAQVKQAVRKPWGIMPAFVESQMSDADAADLAAYFASLPKVAEPGKWRFEPAAGAPPGQATLINIGCGQCHGVNLDGPRGNLGAVNADFDYFANLVYNHTTALGQHRALLGNNATNIDMGNYSRTRLSEGMLRQIYTRLYFSDETANGTDAILNVVPADRRGTLIAHKQPGGAVPVYRFDIRLHARHPDRHAIAGKDLAEPPRTGGTIWHLRQLLR